LTAAVEFSSCDVYESIGRFVVTDSCWSLKCISLNRRDFIEKSIILSLRDVWRRGT